METSITSETKSQQAICGEPENHNQDHEFIEISNDNELKQVQRKDHITEIEETRKNVINAREVYFKYLSSKKMAHTKYSARRRAEKGDDRLHYQPPSSPSQPPTAGKTLWAVIKKKDEKLQTRDPGFERDSQVSKIDRATNP